MTLKDKNYLQLQFWNKVYSKSNSEFQTFFCDIMQKIYPDFRKVRPYGNAGDGGNDGYIPSEGTYFQIYSPLNPQEKMADAANKLKEDFYKIKNNWNEISNIRKYYFVFNDKRTGTVIKIEEALADLRKNEQNIQFDVFLSNKLEQVFFELQDDQIMALNFDIDSRKAFDLVQQHMQKVELDIDRDNCKSAKKTLELIKESVTELNDENLIQEYKLLEARSLLRLEKVSEAKSMYEQMMKDYQNDPRPILYLAEIYLNSENFIEANRLIDHANSIDDTHWLLLFMQLLYDYIKGQAVNLEVTGDSNLPDNEGIKSNFFRLYALILETNNKPSDADRFIANAISLNPDKFSNYNAKLAITEKRASQHVSDKERHQKEIADYLSEVDSVEQRFSGWGELGPRNKALLTFRRLNALFFLEKMPEAERTAKECFEFMLECYFDSLIDELLSKLLTLIVLPQAEFESLLTYLKKSEKEISDELSKSLFFQFTVRDLLFSEGKKFFGDINKSNLVGFIDNLERKNFEEAIRFISDDKIFAIEVAQGLKQFPELRLQIIEHFSDDDKFPTEKLLAVLRHDTGDIDGAFNILRKIDLSNLRTLEAKEMLKIAQNKKAWDVVILLANQILEKEGDDKEIVWLKLQLFTAYFYSTSFKDAYQIGDALLSDTNELSILNHSNQENLLVQTVLARMKRGEFEPAKKLIETHANLLKTFESILGVKVDVYLRNSDPDKALSSIVEGISLIKSPTPEQYGYLYMFFIEIDNLMEFKLEPEDSVTENSFVKFSGQDRWFLVGDGEELDATKITPSNKKYNLLIKKKVGDKVTIEDKYRSENLEYTIENILPIEKYIYWQCLHHFEKLTKEKRWDAVEMIDVPQTDEGIDSQYLIAKMDDIQKAKGDFFNSYCEGNLPLAVLALNQGGLTDAVSCIASENKGFIRFSSGSPDEMNQQKEVARKIIEGEEFYIDGTSAWVLSETGLLHEIHPNIANCKVPQSVITLLMEIKNKFRTVPGQTGRMAYVQGELVLSPINQTSVSKVQENFDQSIKLFESKKENIEIISPASKSNVFSEQRIEPSLSDACVLAQRDKTPIVTEDFLYLQFNELETKKTVPQYCSAYALVSTLYEQGKINFDKYLAFFSYLASYRFRFLPISTDDIEKAVFGDGTVTTFNPENIRLLHLQLTLSEEYGVSFDLAFQIVVQFLSKMLIDDSLTVDMSERIFKEIILEFPTDKDKRELGMMLVNACVQLLNVLSKRLIVGTKVQEKIDSISQFTEIYSERGFILP